MYIRRKIALLPRRRRYAALGARWSLRPPVGVVWRPEVGKGRRDAGSSTALSAANEPGAVPSGLGAPCVRE